MWTIYRPKGNIKHSGEMMACVSKSKPYTGINTLNPALSAPLKENVQDAANGYSLAGRRKLNQRI